MCSHISSLFFFFNDTAPTEIYTLSLHDALPISLPAGGYRHRRRLPSEPAGFTRHRRAGEQICGHDASRKDRKSTRLNSSHSQISYAVFCLKKQTVSPTASFYCGSESFYRDNSTQ